MERRETKANEVAQTLREQRGHLCRTCDRIFAPGEPTSDCDAAGHDVEDFYAECRIPGEIPSNPLP